MASVQLRRYEQILARMVGRVVAKSGLSDVSDSSVVKNILAADAREQDEAYYLLARLRDLFDARTCSGEDLDERMAEIAPHQLKRTPHAFAVGAVRFSRASSAGTVTVKKGTVVKTASGVSFKTARSTILADGQRQSEDVPVTATAPGEAGNVAAGAIIRFASKPPGVEQVVNPLATTQGRAQETDDRFRQRAMLYLPSLARCTTQALKFAALGVVDPDTGRQVEFAHVFEDPIDRGHVILYIDDGAGTAAQDGAAVENEALISSALGGEEYLKLAAVPVNMARPLSLQSSTRGALSLGHQYRLNPASGLVYFSPPLALGETVTASYTPFVGLIRAVQRVIDGDPNDRLNLPGYRAAGVLVRVLAPTVVPVSIEGTLIIDRTDRIAVINDAKRAVLQYINGRGISGDIVRNEIVEQIMGVRGVVDLRLSLPAANITILDDQIPRITSADLIHLT